MGARSTDQSAALMHVGRLASSSLWISDWAPGWQWPRRARPSAGGLLLWKWGAHTIGGPQWSQVSLAVQAWLPLFWPRYSDSTCSHFHEGLVNAFLCVDAQSCPTLCNPMDCSPPGSSVHGILQARILEWSAISFSRRSSPPRDQTSVTCMSPGFAGRFFTTEPLGKPATILLFNLLFLLNVC